MEEDASDMKDQYINWAMCAKWWEKEAKSAEWAIDYIKYMKRAEFCKKRAKDYKKKWKMMEENDGKLE